MTEPAAPRAPITAPECAEQAAAVLHCALAHDDPDVIEAHVEVAAEWRNLGVALAQHSALNRPPPEGPA